MVVSNPYQNISWNDVKYLISTNHWHSTSKQNFFAMYDSGLRHFAISNYIPSVPTYPIEENSFFNISVEEVPKDIIQSPNSEKVKFSNEGMHVTCPGSLYGSPGHHWPADEPLMTWQGKFDAILNELEFEDGGGIIINHPMRSGLSGEKIIEKLKYDDRVLGLEVVNHRSERDYNNRGYYFDGWDYVLSQGYRCFGFFSPDEHVPPPNYQTGDDIRESNWGLGRNVLLVPQLSKQNALRAYRNGEFFGAFFGDRIKFTKVVYTENVFSVETDGAERIDFISYSLQYDTEIVKNQTQTILSNTGEFVPDNNTIFVRAVAYEDKNDTSYEQPIVSERIFTQAVMFKDIETIQNIIKEKEYREKMRRRLLLLNNKRR